MAAVINMTEGAAPSTPAANTHNLFFTTDAKLHTLSDAGADATLATTADVFVTANLADEAVTNAKLAHMEQSTIKGRAAAAGTGDATDLTAAQVGTLLAGQFAAVGDTDWTTIAPLGTYWSTAATLYPSTATLAVPGYRKIAGVVYLRGAAKVTSATVNPLGTLPEGYRPAADGLYTIAVAQNTGTAGHEVLITAAGAITINASTNFTYHLDGVCFIPA